MEGKLICSSGELNLEITLKGGQSFRWTEYGNGYRGIFAGNVWTLNQTETDLFYIINGPLIDNTSYDLVLSKYFRLEVSLKNHCEKWALKDPYFAKCADKACGVRILNQDVVETLFSFICSSNNNIRRISGMVEKLCLYFGTKIGIVDNKEYYDFPTIEQLAGKNTESILRNEGFGYRAAYIAKTAKKLIELGGRNWLENLHKDNKVEYLKAKESLISLPGVGPKVADCICLMSLGHLEAIPVDTHIFQVAKVYYLPHLKRIKSCTPRTHEEICNHLSQLWGPMAGWAQAIVFCAKLSTKSNSKNERKPSPKSTKNCRKLW
ncbi:N-glycosylase/DNA lyase isoform X2 [Prorops nasuta]